MLAVDIGTRNLALVRGYVKNERLVVDAHELVDLGKESLCVCVKKVKHVLDRLAIGVDDVVIEQQNRFNQRAMSLAHAIYMHALCSGARAKFVSPVSKFNQFVKMKIIEKKEIGRGNKKKRKQLAVTLLKLMNEKLELKMSLSGKLDDIGDALIYLFNELHEDINCKAIEKRKIVKVQL